MLIESDIEILSSLLLEYFSTFQRNATFSVKNTTPISFEKLSLLSDSNVPNGRKIKHVLRVLDILFPPNFYQLSFDATSIITVLRKYFQVLISYAHEAYDTKLKDTKNCTSIAKAIISGDKSFLLDHLSTLHFSGLTDLLNSEIDFFKLLSFILKNPNHSDNGVYQMTFASFVSHAYSDDQLAENIEDSYYVSLEWTDVSRIIYYRFKSIFEKNINDETDLYQLLSCIVSIFNTGDVFSLLLLYFLRIIYFLKHPNESGILAISKKVPLPINRILCDDLLFASEESYQTAFFLFLVSVQFECLSLNNILPSIQNLTFAIASKQSSFSVTVLLCLILYGYIDRSALDSMEFSNDWVVFFFSICPKLVYINYEYQANLLFHYDSIKYRKILDVYSSSIGSSLDKLKDSSLIEEISTVLCKNLGLFYCNNTLLDFKTALSTCYNENFIILCTAFSKSQLCTYIISECLSGIFHYKCVTFFLCHLSAIYQPSPHKLHLLSPHLSFWRDIIESMSTSKDVPEILFFFQLFSSYYHFLSYPLHPHYSSEIDESAKSLCVLEFMNIELSAEFQLLFYKSDFDSYLWKLKREIKCSIQNIELSSLYDNKGHLDPVPKDICDAWLPLLKENDLKSSFSSLNCGHLNPNIDKLITDFPTEKDYKYYLLNCIEDCQ